MVNNLKKINDILIVLLSITSIIILFVTKVTKIDRILSYVSILPVMLVPNFVNKFTKFKIKNKYITLYIIFIFLAYFLGSILGLYDKVILYDKVVHTLSGIATSVLAIVILENDRKSKLSIFTKYIYIISFSMLIAVIWESFEYITDIIFNTDAQKTRLTCINDTMQDMLVALLGSVLYIIFNRKKLTIQK